MCCDSGQSVTFLPEPIPNLLETREKDYDYRLYGYSCGKSKIEVLKASLNYAGSKLMN